jgi:Fe-S-cluster-containing dehydrogenase component
MKIGRRDFLKGAAGGGLLLASGTGSAAASESRKALPSRPVGILYDATLCIGCQVCVGACKQANNMPVEHAPGSDPLWNNPRDLSSKTLNIIKKYSHGDGQLKDSTNGYSFVKRHCMHCLDPACVSACPVSALRKDSETGVVSYNEKACIGCRYCQIACPFNIPKFEWDSPFPRIVKCQLCNHILEKGGISACCGACPTGASLFGSLVELQAEARRRLSLTPGTEYSYPVASIGSGEFQNHRVKQYMPIVYGDREVGGTQFLFLAGVPFELLGLPMLPEKSFVALADGIQYAIYKGMVYPLVVLGGLIYMVRKREDKKSTGNKEDSND